MGDAKRRGTRTRGHTMKTDLIGMILNNCGRRVFDSAILDDNGKPLDALHALDYMIMEYAKVRNGGESPTIVVPQQILDEAASAPRDTSGITAHEWLIGSLKEMREQNATTITIPTIMHFTDRDVSLIVTVECVSGLNEANNG